jgi:hypothetical protein
MPAKIRLYIRPSLPDGNRPFLDPAFTANRIAPYAIEAACLGGSNRAGETVPSRYIRAW